ncbi:MAG: hypothetical protein ACRD1Y_04085 [Terriglobales bacterium]
MAAVEPLLYSSAFHEQEFAWPWQDQLAVLGGTLAERLPELANWPPALPSSPGAALVETLMPMRDRPKVEAFLHARPQLVPLLREAADAIRRYWGAGARYRLELVHDPEEGGADADSLVVCIASPSASAHAALDRFDQEWWLERLPLAQGDLNFLVCPDGF